MNTTVKTLIKLGLCVTASMGLFAARAQSVQETGVWAPANVKVDGRLTEYGNSLEANNKTDNVSYTMSNDDKNLYFAIKANDQSTATKIMAGGIDFILNTEGKKKDKDAFIITFPLINRSAMRGAMGGGQRGQRGQGGFGGGQPGGGPPDTAALNNMRRTAVAAVKEMKLKGFKDIPDSVVSIYNEYSLKGAVAYDANGSFVCELAVPFSQLGISLDKTKEIAYSLKINGIQMNRDRNREDGGNGGGFGAGQRGGDGGGNGGGGNGGGGGGNRGGGGGGGNRGGGGGNFGGGNRGGGFGGGGMDMANMFSPTDFWAKYTLAKKQ